MVEIFATTDRSFQVFEGADGVIWQGDYLGMKIVAAVPVDNGSRCVILLDPGTSSNSTFENLLCLERSGKVAWKAELLRTHDCFVMVQRFSERLYANTASGYNVKLDIATGRIVDVEFVK